MHKTEQYRGSISVRMGIIKIYIHLMYWMLNLILSLKVASDGEQ